MAKQPEQILEEQLIAQLQKLGYIEVALSLIKYLKISDFKNLTSNIYTYFKKGITFVQTFLDLYTVRSKIRSSSFESIFTNNNTPPMPIHDAHLGGFLFL
jgi:hypothetical protein